MTNNESLHLPKASLHEGEKKPEIALEFRPNLSDEDAVKQGVEWRRKANLLRETKKGNADQIFQCFSESLGRLRYVIDDPKKQKEYNYILAIIEAAQTALDKAATIADLGTTQGESDTYVGLLESCIKWLTSLPQGDITTETNRLQASAFMNIGTYQRDVNQNHALSEKYFIQAAEKLVEVLKTDRYDEVAQQLLESVNESLQSGKKERQRNGKAVYHICGEFLIPAGLTKKWKSRFFVVDDSAITYWEEKKNWEMGPVAGSTKVKPKGTIMFSDVTDIFSHSDKNCPDLRPSLRPTPLRNSMCIHILTHEKPYNMLSPAYSLLSEYNNWPNILKDVYRVYKIKKDVKSLLNKKTKGLQFDDDDDDEEGLTFTSVEKQRSDSKGKKKVRVNWSDNDTVLPIETSKFPFYTDEDISDSNDPLGIGSPRAFTANQLESQLTFMSDQSTMLIFNQLLDTLEKEGGLKKVVQALIQEDPKGTLRVLVQKQPEVLSQVAALLKKA